MLLFLLMVKQGQEKLIQWKGMSTQKEIFQSQLLTMNSIEKELLLDVSKTYGDKHNPNTKSFL